MTNTMQTITVEFPVLTTQHHLESIMSISHSSISGINITLSTTRLNEKHQDVSIPYCI
jgi:hypothetical protein